MYRVYLADDEMWVVVGLKKRIEKSNLPFCVIGEANNGVVALEEITEKKPDVVFTDIRMPGYSGLELLEHLAKRKLDTKVIFVSGYSEFEYAQSAIRNGAYDYLLKPVDQEKLQEVLQRIIDESKEKPDEGEDIIPASTIQKIMEEIKKNYTENITLTDLADKYGISVSRLSELLKQHFQLSFSEYIVSKRVQKAKELLADEKLSIDAIAEAVGYNDYFYFTKVFKKNTGISPSKYRKELLNQ